MVSVQHQPLAMRFGSLLIVLPAAYGLLVSPTSPHRHTLAFGPEVSQSHGHAHSPDAALASFFYAGNGLRSQSDEVKGLEIAQAFIKHLHPSASFRVDSSFVSEHSRVFHIHYVQQVEGIDVSNSLLNVNIDLSTGVSASLPKL
jgi:hypothetical protein